MSRRTRSDSVQAATKAAQASAVQPPVHIPLNAEERIYFDGITGEFARSEWTSHQIDLAAFLARKMRQLSDETALLSDEGTVIETPGGSLKANPRVTVVKALSGSVLAIRRSLQLHGAVDGKPVERARRNRRLKEAESDSDEPLLARPS